MWPKITSSRGGWKFIRSFLITSTNRFFVRLSSETMFRVRDQTSSLSSRLCSLETSCPAAAAMVVTSTTRNEGGGKLRMKCTLTCFWESFKKAFYRCGITELKTATVSFLNLNLNFYI